MASYKYDYLGRRVSKTTGGTTTKYCYDGAQVIAEYDGSGTLLRKFIYGPGIDEPVAMIDVANSKTYYYHFDGLGSVVALFDANAIIVERYSYDVFGEPNRVSDVNNPYMFTGRRYDNETGLYYYRARYYKPEIGRFLQTDPIGYDEGLNLYTYVRNNPIIFVDPYGLEVLRGQFFKGLGQWAGGTATAVTGLGFIYFSGGIAAPLGGAVLTGVGTANVITGWHKMGKALAGEEVNTSTAVDAITAGVDLASGGVSSALGAVEALDLATSNMDMLNNIVDALPTMGSNLADPKDMPILYFGSDPSENGKKCKT